ncbi:MAG: hypothetical protein KY464_16050, partial [Gemmatimonadetes bacterium]|nr:hypothetical protein [Gemmatimonadota bacterium]
RMFGFSRTRAADLIAQGHVQVDGSSAGKSDRVLAGAVLDVTIPAESDPLEVVPEVVEGIKIIHDDDAIVVIDKPVGVAVSPDGSRVYVATGHAGTVAVIDARTERVIAHVPAGRRPWGIAASPDGRWIYTANGPSDDVTIIDTSTLRPVATLSAGRLPWGVAITP